VGIFNLAQIYSPPKIIKYVNNNSAWFLATYPLAIVLMLLSYYSFKYYVLYIIYCKNGSYYVYELITVNLKHNKGFMTMNQENV
jgi:amino acid transporter